MQFTLLIHSASRYDLYQLVTLLTPRSRHLFTPFARINHPRCSLITYSYCPLALTYSYTRTVRCTTTLSRTACAAHHLFAASHHSLRVCSMLEEKGALDAKTLATFVGSSLSEDAFAQLLGLE